MFIILCRRTRALPVRTQPSSNNCTTFPATPHPSTNRKYTPIHSNSSPSTPSTTRHCSSIQCSSSNSTNASTPDTATISCTPQQHAPTIEGGVHWNSSLAMRGATWSTWCPRTTDTMSCTYGLILIQGCTSSGFVSESETGQVSTLVLLLKILQKNTCFMLKVYGPFSDPSSHREHTTHS